jgi:dienelactone hydrolase
MSLPISAALLHAADRRDALRRMELVMGTPPSHRRRGALHVRMLEEQTTADYVRIKLAYATEDGDRVPAYLLIPRRRTGRRPGVVCLHQTTKIGKAEPAGLGGLRNLHYAHELATRGYVTLSPDYPNFGDYQVDPYALGYASATMKGIVNHQRAIDLLAARPEVDPHRIAAIGHSLGGHNSLFLAAFDTRIRAVVTSCGFTSFHKYMGGDLTGWSHRGYMPRIESVYGKLPDRMPFDFPDVFAAIAPRPVFVNAPAHDSNFDASGVDDVVNAVLPLYAKNRDRLVVVHPAAAHDFPPETRQQAYAFLDRFLNRGDRA